MDKFAIWSYMEAKPGKEQEVEEFLKFAQSSIEQEAGTTTFYTLKMGPSTYGIFNTFPGKTTRDAHVNGSVAKTLYAKAEKLFTHFPTIVQTTIPGAKAPNM